MKALALSLGLAMLPAASLPAQGVLDLLGEYYEEQDQQSNRGGGVMGRGLIGGGITNQTYGSDQDGFGITNQTYGQNEEAPLGSGLLMMTAAAMGYAAMKRNKKQTKK